jgi:mono/diheme cytochrome c family protein
MRWSVSVGLCVVALAVPACAAAQPPDGRAVFEAQCVPCHQTGGTGVPGNFPPLAGNADIFLARDFPARVVLFGMSGKIRVLGQEIEGAMPPLGELLKDEEIAAVVNYVRSALGNDRLRPKDMAPLDAATVAALRGQKGADDTIGYRARLKSAAAQKR